MDWNIAISMINIIMIDLVLSGDNAVVIGMAARKLPPEQQKKAIMLGAGIAIFLRGSLTIIAAYLLNIPYLMTIGGLLLLWIAVKLTKNEEEGAEVESSNSLRSAIKTIIVADAVMSLDNVLAVAGAAMGEAWLVIFGLVVSIPIIMWGSGLVAKLLNQFPWLIFVGAAILGYTAGGLIIEDKQVAPWLFQGAMQALQPLVPYILGIAVIGSGFLAQKRS